MPTISDTNLTVMRYPLSGIVKPCLYPFSGNHVDLIKATAVIAATPDPEDYPEGDYTVTDEVDWTEGKRGSRVIIRDQLTLQINYIGVTRSNNTTGVLRIAGRNSGDRGISKFTPANIEVGNLVEVLPIFPPYSFPTRADLETLELFKRWDDAFSTVTPQTEFPRPQVNMGGHIIGIAGDADATYPGVYRVRIDASASFTWNNNTRNFTWNVPGDGWTLISTTGNARVYDIEPGVYILSIEVEDAVTGKTNIGYRYVYIAEPGMRGGLLADDRWTFRIENDRQTLAGRSMTLVITSDTRYMRENGPTTGLLKNLVDDEFIAGTPVLFSYEHWHSLFPGWFLGAIGRAIHATTLQPICVSNYIGYVRDYSVSSTRGGIETARINLVSPIEYCDQLHFRAQELNAVDDPLNWQEVHRDLSNAAFVPFYILDNHTFLNTVHDYDPGAIGSGLVGDDDEAYPAPMASFYQPRWALDGGTILETIQGIQRTLMQSNMGCISDGSIKFRRHPLFERQAIRDSIPNVMNIYDTDLVVSDDPEEEVLTYDRDDWLRAAETEGTFLITTDDISTAEVYTARTGLYAPEQGREVQTMPQFLALTQEDGQLRVGNYHQLTNAPVKGITFALQNGMDAIEPAMLEWYTLVIGQSDAFYPFPYDPIWTPEFLTGYKMLPTEVVRQWEIDKRGMLKTPVVTWIPNSIGEPAPIKPNEIPSTFGEWCYTFDFQVSDGGWATFLPTNGDAHPVDFWNGSGRGTYSSGIGWSAVVFTAGGGGYGAVDVGLSIKKTFDPCIVKRIEMYANVPGGFGGDTFNIAAYYFENGGAEIAGSPVTTYGEVNYVLDLGDGVDVEAVGIHIIQTSSGIPLAGLAIRVTLYGSGDISADFGESNCG